jgi:hypothetical protein
MYSLDEKNNCKRILRGSKAHKEIEKIYKKLIDGQNR